ncbi:MAG TPA: hypothetical protein O0X70_07755 [Methanocorpusculum sp.]|nr:hypothetical protein [Methanocorpusculum sp.]
MGESYNRVQYNSINEEHILLINDRISVPEDALRLYSDKQLDQINQKTMMYDKKRFWKSAIRHFFSKTDGKSLTTSTDLYGFTKGKNYRESAHAKQYPEKIIEDAESGTWSPKITEDMTRGKEALLYNVKKLQEAGIKVVIINMPLHPLVSEKITNESRQNYFDLLDQTGATWYDYEFACQGDEYWYKDAHHLDPVTGAQKFAPLMADLIIQEMA